MKGGKQALRCGEGGTLALMNYMLILVPALDAALQKHKRVRVLYQLTPDFEGFTTGSMWDDAKLGLAHLKA